MPEAIARHDTLARAAVGDHRGTVVKTTGDGLHAVFADALDGIARRARDRTRARRSGGDVRRFAARAVRAPHGHHRASRQRLLREHGQPRGAHHERGARRSDPAVASGRRGDSRAAAGGVTLRDLGRVRLRDLASPEHVYQAVHPQLRQDFPALRSLESTPNNLPQQLTSFVGRERGRTRCDNCLPHAGCSRCSGWAAWARRGSRCRSPPRCSRVSRRRVVRRARVAHRRAARAAGGRLHAGRHGGSGSAGDRGARQVRPRP